VPLDGVDREVEFLGDLAVGEAGGDEAQDLHLAVVEGLGKSRRRTTDDEPPAFTLGLRAPCATSFVIIGIAASNRPT
jgi:hypothetical protein